MFFVCNQFQIICLNFNRLFWNTGNIWNEIIYEVQVASLKAGNYKILLDVTKTVYDNNIRGSIASSKAGSNCMIQLDACYLYGIHYTSWTWRNKITVTSKWWHTELYTTVCVVTSMVIIKTTNVVTGVVPLRNQPHYPFAVPLNIVGTGPVLDSEVLYSMAVGIKSWLSTPNYLLVL